MLPRDLLGGAQLIHHHGQLHGVVHYKSSVMQFQRCATVCRLTDVMARLRFDQESTVRASELQVPTVLIKKKREARYWPVIFEFSLSFLSGENTTACLCFCGRQPVSKKTLIIRVMVEKLCKIGPHL